MKRGLLLFYAGYFYDAISAMRTIMQPNPGECHCDGKGTMAAICSVTPGPAES